MDQKAQEDAKNGKFIVEALEVLTEEALETLQGQQTLITYLEMNKANIWTACVIIEKAFFVSSNGIEKGTLNAYLLT